MDIVNNTENTNNTDFDANQKIALKKLTQCQNDKKLDSCMKCEMLIDCEIRDDFVKSTFAKMNKGAKGGFEF